MEERDLEAENEEEAMKAILDELPKIRDGQRLRLSFAKIKKAYFVKNDGGVAKFERAEFFNG